MPQPLPSPWSHHQSTNQMGKGAQNQTTDSYTPPTKAYKRPAAHQPGLLQQLQSNQSFGTEYRIFLTITVFDGHCIRRSMHRHLNTSTEPESRHPVCRIKLRTLTRPQPQDKRHHPIGLREKATLTQRSFTESFLSLAAHDSLTPFNLVNRSKLSVPNFS